MTTRHVERLIDFNHEMLEPLQLHIDEDIHYRKEDIGIRASGYLYLSGKYRAKEGIRLFQELLEVDILAPYEKIADETAFAVHVKDYDYSVKDGDLLIDIVIEIGGLDESTIQTESKPEEPDWEEEIEILEEALEEEMQIQPDSSDQQQSEEDSSGHDSDTVVPEEEIAVPATETAEAGISGRDLMPDTSGWELADLIAFENDNTNYGLDFRDQTTEPLTDVEKIAIPEIERQIRNYITSQQLAKMLQESLEEMENEPVRIKFDLLEIDDAAPVAALFQNEKEAREAWKAEVRRLQKEHEAPAVQPSAAWQNDLAELIHRINGEKDLIKTPRQAEPSDDPIRIDPKLIQSLNEDISPKDASYYQTSHARKPLADDIKPKSKKETEETETDETETEPVISEIPNLEVPFTRDTVFPWEMQSLYDSYEVSIPDTSRQGYVMPTMMERKGGCMYPEDQTVVSMQPAEDMEEMQELLDIIDVPDPVVDRAEDSMKQTDGCPCKRDDTMMPDMDQMMQARHQDMKERKKAEAEDEKKEDEPAGLEDLFEDADSKVVNMRIVIAKENDTYESLARRYQVSESKLIQQNHNKPIHERTLVIIPLD